MLSGHGGDIPTFRSEDGSWVEDDFADHVCFDICSSGRIHNQQSGRGQGKFGVRNAARWSDSCGRNIRRHTDFELECELFLNRRVECLAKQLFSDLFVNNSTSLKFRSEYLDQLETLQAYGGSADAPALIHRQSSPA